VVRRYRPASWQWKRVVARTSWAGPLLRKATRSG
jgi:hypothetical protein